MSADQRTVAHHESPVRVRTTDDQLARLKDRQTVCIYYLPEAPFTFLMEDEL